MDIVASKAEAVPHDSLTISLLVPSPINTNLPPEITSNAEPAGIVASFIK